MNAFKAMKKKELMDVDGGDKAGGAVLDYVLGFVPGYSEVKTVIDVVTDVFAPPPAHAYNTVPSGYQSGGAAKPGANSVYMIA